MTYCLRTAYPICQNITLLISKMADVRHLVLEIRNFSSY